jgi:hypothetical protein
MPGGVLLLRQAFVFLLNVKQQHGDVARCLSRCTRNGDNQRAIAAANTKFGMNLYSAITN